MSHVWDNSQQKGSALLLMLALADSSDDSGFSAPSITFLAQKTRLSERQTHNLVRQLVEQLELFVNRQSGQVNQYLILLDCSDKTFISVLTDRMGYSRAEASAIWDDNANKAKIRKSQANSENADELAALLMEKADGTALQDFLDEADIIHQFDFKYINAPNYYRNLCQQYQNFIYFVFSPKPSDTLLYIGVTNNPSQRFKDHEHAQPPNRVLVLGIDHERILAEQLEIDLIQMLTPERNIRHRLRGE